MDIFLKIDFAFAGSAEIALSVLEGDECSYSGSAPEEQNHFSSKKIEGKVSRQQLEVCLTPLKMPGLNSLPPFTMGLDGHTTTLSISEGLSSSEFSWWGELPEDWEALRPLCTLLLELLGLNPKEVLNAPSTSME